MKADFKITADGKDITDAIANRLESLTLKDERGWESDTLDIVLDDRPDLQGNYIEMPRKGVTLNVSLGYDNELHKMGGFTVSELRPYGPVERLAINATGLDVKGTLKDGRTRGFDNITLGDLVDTIATSHGLQSRVSASLSSVALKRVDQLDESDLNLLMRICSKLGAVLKFSAGVVVVIGKGDAKTSSGSSLPTTPLHKTALSNWDFTLADRDKFNSVESVYRDVGQAKDLRVSAGAGTPRKVLRLGAASHDEAALAAASKLIDLNRRTGSGSLTTKGDARLMAESWIDLQGMRPGLNGLWEISSATHSLNKNKGWVTTLELEINPQ